MLKELFRYLIAAVSGFALWRWAQVVADTNEVWDTGYFFPFYGAALGLGAVLGFVFPQRAWRWGAIVIFALFPAMMFDRPPAIGADMWPVGLFFTAFLALPGALVAFAAAELRKAASRVLTSAFRDKR